MSKMDVTAVKALLAAEHAHAIGTSNASKLTEERVRAIDYYNGEMTDMLPAKGRSGAISSDVQDTVEGLMPALMDIFCSSDEVVRFEPVGPEDMDAAEQETDYVNHVFMQKNRGFETLYSFIKDALLQKNGIVKIWWEETSKECRETYLDQPEDVYAAIVADPEIEVVEHTEHLDEVTGEPLHDVTVVGKRDYSNARVMAVPPEEFLISRKARNIRDATYAAHRVYRTQAELIEQGFDRDQVEGLPSKSPSQNIEEQSRDTIEQWSTRGDTVNEATRLIEVIEHYAIMDYEGDGVARLYRVTTAGGENEILKRDGREEIEPFDEMPFAAMTPVIVTHRFWGRSMADLVVDIQRIKTALLRGMLDNIYLANNNRYIVSESGASERTLDDLLANRPGGVIRVKDPSAVVPIQNNPIAPIVMPAIEYIDATREFRTGVSRNGQGLDANALQNQSATAVNQVFNAVQAKTKLIARIFAETGIKDMFLLLHGVIRKNDDRRRTVRLRNKWVEINPRDWKTRDDMTVNVGLGDGSKAEQLMRLQAIINMQIQAQANPAVGLVTPKELYNSASQFVRLAGFKNPDLYFTDPQTNPMTGQQPPDPEQVKAQSALQLEQVRQQGTKDLELMRLQFSDASEARRLQMQQQADQAKAERDAQLQGVQLQRQAEVENAQMAADIEATREKTRVEMIRDERNAQLKREEILLNAQLERERMDREFEARERESARQHAAESARQEADETDKATPRSRSIRFNRDANGKLAGFDELN